MLSVDWTNLMRFLSQISHGLLGNSSMSPVFQQSLLAGLECLQDEVGFVMRRN